MRSILLILTGLLCLNTRAQSNEAVATVPVHGLEIRQENGLHYADFELSANAGYLEYMKAEADKYASYFVFNTKVQADGVYHCRMGFTHPAVIENFHKMFLAIGVTRISVNGQLLPVNELLTLK